MNFMQKSEIKSYMFLGCLKTGELNMHLNQSILWRENLLTQTQSLVEGYFQELTYIGIIHPFPSLTFDELKEVEKKIRNQLQLYCPKLQTDKLTFYLLSQTFLS